MSELITLSSMRYYEEAKKMLEDKDLLGFVAKISVAIELAEDKEMLAAATYLQAEGLFHFRQYKKAFESIHQALKHNVGESQLRLKNYEGVIYGFLGEEDKAEKLFAGILDQIENPELLAEACLNMVWLKLSIAKERNLADAKKYLDLAYRRFNHLSETLKRKVHNNYSVYYFYSQDYEQAIESINESFKYAEERDLPKLYNNLAEIYLKYDEDGVTDEVKTYLEKAEVIAAKYDDKMEMANSFYTKAMVELKEDQIFTALDTLYLAFEFYKDAEANSYAFDCLLKINDLINNYRTDCLRSMKEKLNNKLKDMVYY